MQTPVHLFLIDFFCVVFQLLSTSSECRGFVNVFYKIVGGVFRFLCPWTNFPVIFTFKMISPATQSTTASTSKNDHSGRYPILVAIVVIFVVILMITMDVRKDKSRSKFNAVIGKDYWIHGKNSPFHYGIVLDCGSSGTRVFIYYWPDHNGNPEHLLNIHQMIDRDGQPVRMKVRPGKRSQYMFSN